MTERLRIITLILIMSFVTAVTALIANIVHYQTAVNEMKRGLEDIASLEAEMVEVSVRHHCTIYRCPTQQDMRWAYKEIVGGARHRAGYEKRKVEITIAEMDGDEIRFIGDLRHGRKPGATATIKATSGLAQPMLRALRGETGTMAGKDYAGHNVLAAYMPIPSLGLGLVAKIDLSALRMPYIRVGLITTAAALILIVAGILIMRRVGIPLVITLEDKTLKLEALNRDLEASCEELQAAMEEMEQTNEDLIESQREIARSEERYRLLVETANEGIWSMDAGHVTTYVNRKMADMLGYPIEEILGKRVEDFMFPGDLEDHSDKMRERHGGKEGFYERRFRRRDGSGVWMLVSSMPECDERGEFTGSFGMFTDITELKSALEIVRESEEKFAKAFINSPVLMSITDLEDGTIVDVNDRFAELSGYTRGEVAGKTTTEIGWIRPEDRDLLKEKMMQEGRVSKVEITVYSRSGRPIDAMLSGEIVTIRGRRHLLAIAIDITEQKIAERGLRESEEKFSKFFHLSPVSMAVSASRDGRYLDVNGRFLEITGYSREEIIGHDSNELGIWQDADSRDRLHHELMSRGAVHDVNAEIRTRDGRVVPVLYSAVTIMLHGEPCVIKSVINISDKIKAENALHASEENYRLLFTEIPSAYSLHEMIYDEKGRAVDYLFLDVNPAFYRLTGLADVAGKTVREIIPGIEDFWIERYGEVVRTGVAAEFEDYAEGLGRWYEVRAFHCGGNRFAVIFHDISVRKKAEAALLEKTEQIDRYFHINLDLLCIADTEGRFINLNPEWEKVIGYPVDELVGRQFMDFVHPDDREATIAAVGQLSLKNDVLDFVNRYRCRDGSYRWVEWRATSPDGKLIYAAARDITERYRAADALKIEKETAQRYLDIAGVIFVVIGSDQRISLINRKGCELLGYAAEEITGMNWFDAFVPSRSRDQVRDVFEKLMRGDVESVEYFENHIVTRSGRERLMAWHNILLKDPAGAVTGTLSAGEDITDRRTMEVDLRKQLAVNMALAGLSGSIISRAFTIDDIANIVLEYARLLTDSSHGIVTEIDPDTGDNVSRAHSWKPGQENEESPGGQIVFRRSTNGAFYGLLGHVINTRTPFFTNDPNSHPAMKDMPAEHLHVQRFLSAPVIYNNEVVGQVALANSAREYTDDDLVVVRRLASLYALAIHRLRAEDQLKRSLEEKTVLLKELHHRVKNNMQVISSLLSLQSRKIDDDRYREMFLESKNRIHAMALVHERMYHSEDMARIDFSRYVRELTERIRYSFIMDSGRIRLAIDVRDVHLSVDEAVPCGIIINELVSNAFKHAFPDNREGTLQVMLAREAGGKRRLCIRDDGVGLPGPLIEDKEKSLGMQIVRSLVRQIKGSIDIRVDGGTTVEILF